MSRPLFVAGVLAATLSSASARAHHVETHALGYAEPRSSIVFVTEHTAFDLDQHGRFVGETVRLTHARKLWALSASVPFYSLFTHDDSAAGLGDASVSAQVRVLGDGSQSGLWVGGAFEFPTGNADKRLGNGHVEILPAVYGAWAVRPSWTILRATVADAFSIDTGHHEHEDGHADHEHQGSLTQPHTDHELRYSVGFLQYLVKDLFVELAGTGVTVLESDATGETLGWGNVTAGVVATRGWIITGGYSHPLFGDHRFESKVTFASQVLF